VEAGIVRLIADLGKQYGAAQLYISHNLGLIMTVCERVGVMYSREVVEEGRVEDVFSRPLHPYTHGLFGCIPLPGADKHVRPLTPIPGQLPLPPERPPGCYFGPRCDHFKGGLCDAGAIALESATLPEAGRRVRCLRWGEVRWLLMDIQREHRTTLLFISHDLGVVRYLADRVIVMYLGQIMEAGTTEEIFNPPYHPYTEALLSAAPIADPEVKKREIVLAGNLPSAMNPPAGCPFETRCPRKLGKICEAQRPPLQRRGAGHRIACHIAIKELRTVEPVIVSRSK
jgi:oligopeptide/dipeptide ABC transporter ATP-binding protein